MDPHAIGGEVDLSASMTNVAGVIKDSQEPASPDVHTDVNASQETVQLIKQGEQSISPEVNK